MSQHIIACDVFLDELAALGADPAGITWLEMGLHDRPAQLRREIQCVIDRVESREDIDTILLAYGQCGNGLVGIRASRCTLVIPRAHDCISVLLGGTERHNAVSQTCPGTYFYSPGWIRGKRVPGPDRDAHVRAFYVQRYEDDEEMVEELLEADRGTFAQYKHAAYVDLTGDDASEDYCRNCARSLGWSFRRLQGDPALLGDLLAGRWTSPRILVVPPGQEISLGEDGLLACVEPV